MKLNAPVDEHLVADEKPDVLIVATGAEPSVLDIPGIDGPNVLKSWDVLSGQASVPGKIVAVAGGGLVGCETALYLAAKGKKVTIIEMAPELAADMEPITRFDFLTERLPKAGIRSITNRIISEINAKGVTVLNYRGQKSLIEADNVVTALGSKPVNTLAERVKGQVSEIYVIGDGKKPRQIINGTFEGAAVARMI